MFFRGNFSATCTVTTRSRSALPMLGFTRGRARTGFKIHLTDAMAAEDEGEGDVLAISSPRILFVRLRKDKSRYAIEDEIFKCINKALEESGENKSFPEEPKNCITLPDFAGCRILQVAVGPEYVGILLDDGRVGRFKCVTKNLDSTKKLWKPDQCTSEPSFQVQSDEVFARQLQSEFLNNGATTSTSSGRPNSLTSNRGTPSLSSRIYTGNGRVSDRPVQSPIPSGSSYSSNASRNTLVTRESQTESGYMEALSGNGLSLDDSQTFVGQADTIVQSKSMTKSSESDENTTIAKHTSLPSTSNGISTNQEKSKVQDNINQKLENSSENVPVNGRSVSSSSSSVARRSVSSPRLLQRTVFATNYPMMRQIPAPFLFPPGSVSFPFYSNSASGPMFGPRGSLRLEPRVVRAQLAEAGVFPVRGSRTSATQGREERPSADNKTASCTCNDADFCFPEVGNIQWIELENVSGLGISLFHSKRSPIKMLHCKSIDH